MLLKRLRAYSFLENEPELLTDLARLLRDVFWVIGGLVCIAFIFGLLDAWLELGYIRPEYWNSLGSAASGLAGTAIALIGAVFGIMLASLGLRLARSNDDRETVGLVKESVERSLELFIALDLLLTELEYKYLPRSLTANDPFDGGLIDVRSNLIWKTLRLHAQLKALDDVEISHDAELSFGQAIGNWKALREERAAVIFEQLVPELQRLGLSDVAQDFWSFHNPPFDPASILGYEPEALERHLGALLAALEAIERSAAARLFIAAQGADIARDFKPTVQFVRRASELWGSARRSDPAWLDWFIIVCCLTHNAAREPSFKPLCAIRPLLQKTPLHLRQPIAVDADPLSTLLQLVPGRASFDMVMEQLFDIDPEFLRNNPRTEKFLEVYRRLLDSIDLAHLRTASAELSAAALLSDAWAETDMRDLWAQHSDLGVDAYDALQAYCRSLSAK